MTEQKETSHNEEIVHVYDGIQEADNALPRWWLATFFGTMVFALGYWFAYHEYNIFPQPLAQWSDEQAAAAAASGREMTDGEVTALAQNADLVASGHTLFTQNCVACHGDRAEGKIGPNLTDTYWIHGGAPSKVLTTIRDGVAAKGMPAWGPVLGAGNLRAVVAYVMSVRDTNVAGKAHEGELFNAAAGAAPEGAAAPAPEGAAAPAPEGAAAAPAPEGAAAAPAAEGAAPSNAAPTAQVQPVPAAAAGQAPTP